MSLVRAALVTLVVCVLPGSLARAQQVAHAVAARDLPRGTVLSAADIHVNGATADTSGVLPGWVARRAIRAGEALRGPAVAPAPLVRRGSAVTVEFGHGALHLTLSATALGDGHVGDRVAVRPGPNRILRGTVSGPGRVTLSDSSRLP